MGIYNFKGGIRIPAGSGSIYPDGSGMRITSINGGLNIYNTSGPVRARCVCQVPVPEKAKIRQFVMVGNVRHGEIFGFLGSVPWNKPHEGIIWAHNTLSPTTPYEVRDMQQKQVFQLPLTGSESLTIDRINTYYIDAYFRTDTIVMDTSPLRLYYFEIYWD